MNDLSNIELVCNSPYSFSYSLKEDKNPIPRGYVSSRGGGIIQSEDFITASDNYVLKLQDAEIKHLKQEIEELTEKLKKYETAT